MSDILLVHFFLEQRGIALRGFELFLERREAAVLELGGAVQVVGALGLLDVLFHLFDLGAQFALLPQGLLIGLPLRAERAGLGLQLGQLLFQLFQAVAGGLVGFLLQRLALDLELHLAAQNLVELRGHGIDLGPQLGGGFIHQIDRLVRQETIGDVAVA